MMVDTEQDPSIALSGRTQIHRRLPAVAAHLQQRSVHFDGGRGLIEGQPLIGRHEAPGCLGRTAQAVLHQLSRAPGHITRSRKTYLATHTVP